MADEDQTAVMIRPPPRRGRGAGGGQRPSALVILVVVTATAFALAFASAPWFTFRAMRSAAVNQDVQALGELIDYGAVRAGLRSQIRPSVAAQIPAPDPWRDPVGAVRRALRQPLRSPPPVDSYLTPNALARLSEGRPRIIYWGLRRCRIAVPGPGPAAADRRAVFTFARRGLLDWTLVQIRLPTPPAGE